LHCSEENKYEAEDEVEDFHDLTRICGDFKDWEDNK
jgi:hypothetical protein